MEIKIRKIRLPRKGEPRTGDLDWTDEEFASIVKKVLKLRNDQLVAFMSLVGVEFDENNREDVVEEINSNNLESAYLPIIVYEADSKENLLWWLDFFEKANKKETSKK